MSEHRMAETPEREESSMTEPERAESSRAGEPATEAAEKLKPCPFCGCDSAEVRTAERPHEQAIMVRCSNCYVQTPTYDARWYLARSNVMRAWNRRAP